LEVRQDLQRRRLFRAAAIVFARGGYVEATAEAIAREAGMSKATFYEHFDNKEDCIIAQFDAASEMILTTLAQGRAHLDPNSTSQERIRVMIGAFVAVLEAYPDEAQTLLVEIVGAGPRAQERRDKFLENFSSYLDDVNKEASELRGVKRFVSAHDAFAIVGACVELASRRIRTGVPENVYELEPVMERIVNGLIDQGTLPAER
jgi:AcrR family transcriptional regulator